MNFITILKEKVFTRYPLVITLDKKSQYQLVSYSNEDLKEHFFLDLEKTLSLPLVDKSLKFSFSQQEFKGFKNYSLQAFIKQNPSMEEFDNVFHSFYKNFALSDLFNTVFIKNSYSGSLVKSPFEPYILYFLKQNFTHQKLYPQNFLSILNFNFPTNEKNYISLKESLYTFLHQHVNVVKKSFYLDDNNYDEKKLKDFESELYNCIGKFIKPHDMKIFNDFWPHILIKKTQKNMIVKVENTFAFDLNFSYLSDTFDQITNEEIARKTCLFINRVINEKFSEHLCSSITKETSEFSRFFIEFHSNIKIKNLPDIIEHIIELHINSNQIKNSYLKNEYQKIWDENIAFIDKLLLSISLSNKLEDKNPQSKFSNKKSKI